MFFLLAATAPGFGQVIDPILTNYGPPVRIISPPNHAFFLAPVNIPIFAYVAESGFTTNVEFYANSIDLGPGRRLGATTLPPGTVTPNFVLPGAPVTKLGDIFWLVWSNAPPGAYALTAVTKRVILLDGAAILVTSPPVNITILPKVIPTNGPSIVSIVAPDPIAVVGSNSWIWHGPTNPVPVWSNWPSATPVPFTNWGPKNGLFAVRRCGGESNTINVAYSISGTASNGVDYVQLPGTITIDAGSDAGLIPVVPIDHGPPYVPKTVILKLTPGISAAPQAGYIVGFPKCAEVLIVHDVLPPAPVVLPDGTFQLGSPGPDGAWFTVESSPDLQNWTAVETNQVVNGAISYLDCGCSGAPQQFYQALPNPAAQ